MGFGDGRIVFNNDNARYRAGQILSGKLEFELSETTKIHGVYVRIRGACLNDWTTKHTRKVNDRDEQYTVQHGAHEDYMNVTIYLIGDKTGETTLKLGRHVFPFECQIPADCPSSFEGSAGCIKYQVKAIVEHIYKEDQIILGPFKVEAPLDLNDNPHCKGPIKLVLEQKFTRCCFNLGEVLILVKVPVAGWVPLQVIPIEFSCKNSSSVKIKRISIAITKVIIFIADENPDIKTEIECVTGLILGPYEGHSLKHGTFDLKLPEMEVPNLKTCNYIKIAHQLAVKLTTSGYHPATQEYEPIFLGTIPLSSLVHIHPTNSDVDKPQEVTSAPIVHQPIPSNPIAAPSPYPPVSPPAPSNPAPAAAPVTINVNVNSPPPQPQPTQPFIPQQNPSPYPTPHFAPSPYTTHTPYNPNMVPPPYPTQNLNHPGYPTSPNFGGGFPSDPQSNIGFQGVMPMPPGQFSPPSAPGYYQ